MQDFLIHLLMPAIIALVAGTLAVWLHAVWNKGESWYVNANPALKTAIGTVIAMALTTLGTSIPMLQGATQACQSGASTYLTTDCMNAIGALFSKDNIALIITTIITIGGHINATVTEQLKYTKVMAARAGITQV